MKNEQRETTWWLWWHLVKKIQFQTSEQHLFSCHSPLISSLFYLARKNMLLLLAENECLHGGLGGIPKGLTNPGKSNIYSILNFPWFYNKKVHILIKIVSLCYWEALKNHEILIFTMNLLKYFVNDSFFLHQKRKTTFIEAEKL